MIQIIGRIILTVFKGHLFGLFYTNNENLDIYIVLQEPVLILFFMQFIIISQ